MAEKERNVTIGEITSTHGLKGEVKVMPQTDFPERFEDLDEIYVEGDNFDGRMLQIERVWYHKKGLVIKFAGINDISEAEELRGKRIMISEEELLPLEENEFYIHDILGLEVVTVDGVSLGKVTEIKRSPANDIYVTDRAMIPAIKEFVVKVDIEEKKIVIRSAEGLVQE